MKILHIIAGIPPESGVAAVVKHLASEQQRLGHEVAVAWTEGGGECASARMREWGGENARMLECVNARMGKERENISSSRQYQLAVGEGERGEVRKCESAEVLKLSTGGVREVMFSRSWPQNIYFSWGMLLGLGYEIKNADVVHVHGCWTFPVWWGAWLALRNKKTLVMSPHGSLDPVRLNHSGWKKKAVGWIDRWLLRRASVIHATCEAEKRWIQAFLGTPRQGAADPKRTPRQGEAHPGEADPNPLARARQTLVVIPNGVGIPAPGRGSP